MASFSSHFIYGWLVGSFFVGNVFRKKIDSFHLYVQHTHQPTTLHLFLQVRASSTHIASPPSPAVSPLGHMFEGNALVLSDRKTKQPRSEKRSSIHSSQVTILLFYLLLKPQQTALPLGSHPPQQVREVYRPFSCLCTAHPTCPFTSMPVLCAHKAHQTTEN